MKVRRLPKLLRLLRAVWLLLLRAALQLHTLAAWTRARELALFSRVWRRSDGVGDDESDECSAVQRSAAPGRRRERRALRRSDEVRQDAGRPAPRAVARLVLPVQAAEEAARRAQGRRPLQICRRRGRLLRVGGALDPDGRRVLRRAGGGPPGAAVGARGEAARAGRGSGGRRRRAIVVVAAGRAPGDPRGVLADRRRGEAAAEVLAAQPHRRRQDLEEARQAESDPAVGVGARPPSFPCAAAAAALALASPRALYPPV